MDDADVKDLLSKVEDCRKKKNYRLEVELLEKICKLKPNNPYAKHDLARALENYGKFEEAREIFEEIIAKYPSVSRAHNNYAALLVRMGAEWQTVIPHLIDALFTSQDEIELINHSINLFASISLGYDEDVEGKLNYFESRLPDFIDEACENGYFPTDMCKESKKNYYKDYLQQLVRVHRKLASYRKYFAERKWHLAEVMLDETIADFSEIKQFNRSKWVDLGIKPIFELSRGVFQILERMINGEQIPPKQVLESYENLFERIKKLSMTGSSHTNLLNIIGWFLADFIRELRFLAGIDRFYTTDSSPKKIITQQSSFSFTSLGSDLVSLLNFTERQCEILKNSMNTRSTKISEDNYKKAWTSIVFYCKSLLLDFHDVDIEVAKEFLGWEKDPFVKAKREIEEFKSFIERQAYKTVFNDGNPQEELARSLLQAFLKNRSYREVPVRGGRSDVLVITEKGRLLYETKIWRGPDYYEKGIAEIEEYIKGENDDSSLLGVFYVVFDPTKANKAVDYQHGPFSTRKVGDFVLNTIIVHINPPTPSNQ
ncbi:MAG: tetratricopeptide repeat protein [Candidatus Odinarchaeota archaeon]